MWLHICMAGPMTAYGCDVASVLAAQMPYWPTNVCLLLLSAVPYFTYFDAHGSIPRTNKENFEQI